jgi:anthranilate synthase/aminodeoxychorismate synthase-like glutamine amidotransferase
MILVIDNYDSFTYNLVQYLGELSTEPIEVFRNDKISAKEILAKKPSRLVISPGPGNPSQAGVSKEALASCHGKIPVLGICLGHQCMGEVFGGKVIHAPAPMHGKTSRIEHDGKTIFSGIASPFTATRYHSLMVDPDSFPADLEVSARSDDNVIMGLRHKHAPTEGLQFHPESILTQPGKDILRNFLTL